VILVGRVARHILPLAALCISISATGCTQARSRTSITILSTRLSIQPSVHVYLSSLGEASVVRHDKFERDQEFERHYRGRWRRWGRGYVIDIERKQGLRRGAHGNEVGAVATLHPACRIILHNVGHPRAYRIESPRVRDLDGAVVHWSIQTFLTRAQLRTEMAPVPVGPEKEITLEGTRLGIGSGAVVK